MKAARGRGIPLRLPYLLLGLGVLVTATPYLWMISSSFKNQVEIFAFPPTLIPQSPTLENYGQVMDRLPLLRIAFNSFLVSLSVTGLAIFFGALAGYAFARLKFIGREFLFGLALFTMMFPAILFLIPRFMLIKQMGLVGTYPGLILPFVVNGLSIFLFRQFFALIPNDLRDAAIMDGCSEMGVLFRIMLPLSKPVFVTAGVFTFMDTWNDFLWPMVTTMGYPELMTMPVGLAFFSQSYIHYWGASMAMATLFTVPVVLVYLFFQRCFVESIALTGLKG